jgi:hypothetical protein
MGLAIATMAAAAPSASAETVTFSTPFAGDVVNTCTLEDVAITGTLHMKDTANITLDSTKTQLEINTTNVSGTTPLGVKYTMNSQYSEIQHASGDDAQQTVEQTLNMTRQGEMGTFLPGPGDDLRVHMLVHITTTNGVPTATTDNFRSDCR